MAYIQADKISYRYNDNIDYTLKSISFRLDSGSRIGIVGDNGSGKSTLIRILAGRLKEEGLIYRGLNIGVLHQEDEASSKSVLDQLYINHSKLLNIRKKLDDYSDSYLHLFSEYDELGGWSLEAEIEKYLNCFQLSKKLLTRDLTNISGGEKTKIRIISLILQNPDFMLLDEPTNHLDLDTIVWLENFLVNQKKPYCIVSHDRAFLDKVSNKTWELEDGVLIEYAGNYSFYKDMKKQKNEYDQHNFIEQHRKITKLKKAVQQRKNWATKILSETGSNGYAPSSKKSDNKAAMKRCKVLEKRIEMIIEKDEKEKPKYIEPARILFRQKEGKCGKLCLNIENLSKSFNITLFKEFNLKVRHGEKIAITGKNGSGKTTLLKMIMGIESYDEGTINIPESVDISYFSQEYENLNYSNTLLDEITGGDYGNQSNVRRSLGSIGFTGDSVFDKVGDLSPGERSKLAIIKVMLSESSLLLLDEPTNHLELRTREVVEEALTSYKGTIIFISHDRMFIDKIATSICKLESK